MCKYCSKLFSGYDIPMQEIARILKNNNVSQFNIIDVAKINRNIIEERETRLEATEPDDKRTDASFINIVENPRLEVSSQPQQLMPPDSDVIIKRNIHHGSTRDLVFSILSNSARRKALREIVNKKLKVSSIDRIGHQKDAAENTEDNMSSHSHFDSVSFLLRSGFNKDQFQRLLSKVKIDICRV